LKTKEKKTKKKEEEEYLYRMGGFQHIPLRDVLLEGPIITSLFSSSSSP